MRWSIVAGGTGFAAGVLVTWLLLSSTPAAPPPGSACGATPEATRQLGPDEAPIGSIRVTLETGTVNGAGTNNPILIWFDNVPHSLTDDPRRDFRPGRQVVRSLSGSALPKTLGELRRSSILLTMHLHRAQIAASWYCERALIEVRLEGAEEFAPYLETDAVGWLSQDEAPRRSTAYALQ